MGVISGDYMAAFCGVLFNLLALSLMARRNVNVNDHPPASDLTVSEVSAGLPHNVHISGVGILGLIILILIIMIAFFAGKCYGSKGTAGPRAHQIATNSMNDARSRIRALESQVSTLESQSRMNANKLEQREKLLRRHGVTIWSMAAPVPRAGTGGPSELGPAGTRDPAGDPRHEQQLGGGLRTWVGRAGGSDLAALFLCRLSEGHHYQCLNNESFGFLPMGATSVSLSLPK